MRFFLRERKPRLCLRALLFHRLVTWPILLPAPSFRLDLLLVGPFPDFDVGILAPYLVRGRPPTGRGDPPPQPVSRGPTSACFPGSQACVVPMGQVATGDPQVSEFS